MEKVKDVIEDNNKRSGRTFMSVSQLAQSVQSRAQERRSTSKSKIESFSAQIDKIFETEENFENESKQDQKQYQKTQLSDIISSNKSNHKKEYAQNDALGENIYEEGVTLK